MGIKLWFKNNKDEILSTAAVTFVGIIIGLLFLAAIVGTLFAIIALLKAGGNARVFGGFLVGALFGAIMCALGKSGY